MDKKPSYEELEKRIQKLEQAESDRKLSEKRLIHSHDLMDYIISHARSAIAVFDRDFKYVYVSKRYLKDYRVTEKNVIGKHHYDVFPDIPEKWKDVHKRSLAGEVLSSEEDPYYRADGSVNWTRWECRPWYESDGSIGGIIIYNEIINEWKQIEETLRKSEQLLSAHLLNTPIGAISWDLDFKTVEWNPAAESIFGYSKAEAMGKRVTELILPEDLKEMVEGIFQDILSEKGGARSINENITKAGKRIKCDWYNTVLKNTDGEIIGMASLVNDITDIKRSEDINKTLFAISNAVNITLNLNDLYKQIHCLLGKVIDVTNFFIAIIGEKKNTLHFPYYVDTVDEDFLPITDYNPAESLTGLVISERKPQLLKMEQLTELSKNKGIQGTVPLIWMGVPLMIKDGVIGVISVQSYTNPDLYNKQDLQVLSSISDQIAIAIDRKRTEDVLKESEEKYRTLVETMPNGSYLSTPEGYYVDANPAFVSMLGYDSLEELKSVYIPTDIYVHENERRDDRRNSEFIDQVEIHRHKKKDGTIIWIEDNARYIKNNSGTVLYHQGICKDITDRKRAEEALQSSEMKYRELFEQSPIGLALCRMDGQLVSINPAYEKIIGYSTDEALKLSYWDITPKKYAPDEKRQMEQIESTGGYGPYEKEYIHKDGHLVPVRLNGMTVVRDGEKFIWSSVEDITALKKAEKEKNALEVKLRQSQKMEAIGTLAGGIAHDFNNILTGIFGYSQLLEMHINEPEKIEKYVEQIIVGAKRASDLTQQILTFSRQAENQKLPTNVFVILNESLKLLRSSIPTTIEIKKDLHSKAMIMADPTQIHQVILNLCTNAYQAMAETGGVLTVGLHEIEISDPENIFDLLPGNYLKLEISDTGHGIEKRNLRRIFDPYFTLKEFGKGTGLGLSIVDGIVKKDKGFIKVHSKVGKGSMFQVFWPVIEQDHSERITKTENAVVLKGTERIMLVDDETAILDTLKTILERQGYDIAPFNDGRSALKAFAENSTQFDLIMTDMTMPKMTGEELSVEILKIRKDMPIVLFTGYSEKISDVESHKLGIRKYLQKPVTVQELSVSIREVLGNHL